MGRKPIYPKDNCVGCDKCIYDKRYGNEICIVKDNKYRRASHKSRRHLRRTKSRRKKKVKNI